MKKFLKKKIIHYIFEASILLKGFFALSEIIGGAIVLIISQQFVTKFVLMITQNEISEDPNDFISNYLINATHNFSAGTQHFVALYLLAHGIIKLFIVIGLLKNKLWAYPASLIIFSLFGLYQIYRYNFTHSPWLIIITILDIITIGLIWHEYRYRRQKHIT